VRFVTLNTLQIKNFLSVGEKPVVINFQNGINVITGINHDKEDSKNGVGKSTVVDALYFAFFGTTIRELSKDFIVNSSTKKNCEVKLTFQYKNNNSTSTFEIVRCLAPTKCFLSKDGIDITRSTLAKTNEYIQQLIRSTGRIFQNSVVMTINNTVPFMAQTKTDKRKFIESVLNLEVFSEMLLKTRDEYNEVKKDYEVLSTKNETLVNTFNFNKQQLDLFEVTKKVKIENIDKKITDNTTKYSSLSGSIVDVPQQAEELINKKEKELKEDLIALKKTQAQSHENLTEINTKVKLLEQQLKEINKVGSVCTTCNRAYTDDGLKHKEENIAKINNSIKTLIESRDKANSSYQDAVNQVSNKEAEISEIHKKKDKLKDIKSTNTNMQMKIDFIKDTLKELLQEKTEVLNSNNHALEQSVLTLEVDVTNNKQQLTKLDDNLSVLECVKFIVSEEGVKSYIVKKVLQVLNARLAYYLEMLQANCLCQFNEYFDETITDEKGEIKSYFNFSGGERKRIDLACLFAFLDIRRMQGDINFSTIFYDELLDSSLDDKGVQLVLRVLRDRYEKYNESCYIITHRGTAITAKVDNTVLLEKRNGFTYIL
jgi:DNA repair exonuclease SbcCD ATPase subunit